MIAWDEGAADVLFPRALPPECRTFASFKLHFSPFWRNFNAMLDEFASESDAVPPPPGEMPEPPVSPAAL